MDANELIQENRHLKDQLATLSKTHAKDRQRLDELLSDYVRVKRTIREALGMTGEDAMIHSFQLREIRSRLNAELCQPCPPPTPPRQETADGQGLA